ncbi:hypothetical protein C1645_839740 [Glomus cerebriforme]|uniref:Uncharacterized protein n=1 Tax=Glomus cerebriforme TaxID=658196 RepID=A0A397S6A2_9GLOM|nr:hypothetical protein C1645_839740 [Glomus cerebriforme]
MKKKEMKNKVKEMLVDEIMEKVKNEISRKSMKHRIRKAERIYEIFNKIGGDKMDRIVISKYSGRDFIKLTVEEKDKIMEEFTLEEIKALYKKERHEKYKGVFQIAPSCLECYKVKEGAEPEQKELEEIMKKEEKLLDVIVVSIKYRNKPDYKKIVIILVIKIICKYYMFDEDDNIIIKEKETEENLLGNKELLRYGYIIKDDELDKRKIVEENSFIRKCEDIEELESSEDKSEFGQVKKLVKRWKEDEDIRTIGKINLMLEKRYELEEIERNELIRNVLIDDEIDIQELKKKLENRELPLRVKGKMALRNKDDNEREKEIIIAENGIENDKELIDKYVKHRNLLDDELIIKLNKLGKNIKEEENDTDDSEKIGEILSPEEHEIWKENSENINENEIEDN